VTRLLVITLPLLATAALIGCPRFQDAGSDDDAAGGHGGATSGAGGAAASTGSSGGGAPPGTVRVRLAQFNLKELSTDKLLDPADEQASAAAQILARFDADIVSINEIQYDIQGIPSLTMPGVPAASAVPGGFDGGADNARRLADRIAAAGVPEGYAHTLLTLGNSGFHWEGQGGSQWFVLRGWGEFEGRFNTAVLSRYPILGDQVRIIHDFAWEDLPGNVIGQMQSEIGESVPAGFPLFEKSLNIVPLQIDDEVLYLVMFHPVAPAFNPINPYRNFDELQGLRLFLDGALPGVPGLPAGAKFVVVGDLNADPEDGDSFDTTISQILEHPLMAPPVFPAGAGTRGLNGQYNTYLSGCGNDDGSTVSNPTTRFQLQLDYILPSATVGAPLDSFLFFPDHVSERADFDLACSASDHRMLYFDLAI
jgi:hypothetical protein